MILIVGFRIYTDYFGLGEGVKLADDFGGWVRVTSCKNQKKTV